MDSIKKFFEKKKKDAKFKMAGEGKKLTSSSSSSHSSRSHHSYSVSNQRYAPTAEAQRAGAAALARFETKTPKEVNWSLQAIKAQAKREMEMEEKMSKLQISEEGETLGAAPKERQFEGAPMLAVQGVYFYCPLLGSEIGTYEETKSRMRDFLFSQLGEDKGVAACLIIHTCNKNKEKVATCIETLCKYIENIVSNPDEPKYRKIRQSNRAYEDRIAPMEGTKEFMEAAGFEEHDLPFNESTEKFWVFPEENMNDLSSLETLRDALVGAEPLKPQLDRNLQVVLPNQAAKNVDLPPEFFVLSVEELKKEMQQRNEAVERSSMLMTKAMREKMELRELRKYRFSLIRVRFPDGIILQGTFAVNEKFGNVCEFVRENLVNDWRPFFLCLSGGGQMTEEEKSLFDLHLVPAVVFNFEWDPSVQDPNLDNRIYLKEEILMLLQAGE
ncbi:UBX domain-containing protein 6 [Armadillidium nasatum]|uniref:UBX domain-containing protein 6 n=1 Tax=Armadillidium nasatum TaxID=96803 RepID=A0A5N5SRN1_9CRUS|nr:UBX domain-containing protein 6 [Armadillidium nasatum]